MNKHITYSIAIIIFGSLLVCTTAKDKNDLELGNINCLEKRFENLAGYFSELRQEERLPGIVNEYEIKTFSVVILLEEMRKQPYFTTDMLKSTKMCKELYFIRFNLDLNEYRYFYCFEDNDIVFNSSYVKKEENWVKLK